MSYSAQGMAKVFRTHGKGKGIVGVEIGVDRGKSTRGLIENCPNIMKIYAIDPWRSYNASLKTVIKQNMDNNYEAAKEYLKEYTDSGVIEIIRKPSIDAIPQFEDESLDFVYIDGDHSFVGAYSDLCEWYKKVKKGGIASGHDFRPHKDVEVRRAVYQFAEENNYKVTVEEDGWSWWFVK